MQSSLKILKSGNFSPCTSKFQTFELVSEAKQIGVSRTWSQFSCIEAQFDGLVCLGVLLL